MSLLVMLDFSVCLCVILFSYLPFFFFYCVRLVLHVDPNVSFVHFLQISIQRTHVHVNIFYSPKQCIFRNTVSLAYVELTIHKSNNHLIRRAMQSPFSVFSIVFFYPHWLRLSKSNLFHQSQRIQVRQGGLLLFKDLSYPFKGDGYLNIVFQLKNWLQSEVKLSIWQRHTIRAWFVWTIYVICFCKAKKTATR